MTPFADTPLPLPDRPSVAVLPLADASGDYEAQIFADGVTEHLTYTLACTPGLFVSGRNSAFTFRRQQVSPAEVGRALGVAHVLEGTIARADNRVALSARLSATDGTGLLWSQELAGSAEEIFALQTAIVERTVATIAPGMRLDRSGIARTRFPADVGIYAQFLSTYATFSSLSRASIHPLLHSLDAVIQSIPEQPLPLALKAQCYTFLVAQGWSGDGRADAEAGVRFARQALSRPSARESPATLMMAGHTLAFLGQDYEVAVGHLDRSLRLNPNSTMAYERSGWVRCYVGEPELAIAHFRSARRQSPLDRDTFLFDSGLGLALCMQGEHEEAVHWLDRAITDKPSWTSSYRVLAASLAHLGRHAQARDAVRALLAREPGYRIARALQLYRPSPGKEIFVSGLRAAGVPE
ncbi:hypothetical protein OPKNFCMD_0991 [Methylobacterium crusticola]|uniref:Tetratricopeptide repeat protein n=1 Tax=Methylobacterium crusticola TaxID=1697972 RepID=A0ABQ4QU94_9HYPH|nr:tetratricopeptide repeat protein [Methylobacterium crusticola]GJD48274.1 hypothetical protein OPKNFCMD_0991 [Methylobacterium crusticola]